MAGREDKMKKEKKKEKILNIPNTLTVIRIVMSIFLIHMVFSGYSDTAIVITFIIAALTDFFDGQIARRFDMITEFGRITDPIADRLLLLSIMIALVMRFGLTGVQNLLFIMSREIVSLPAFIFIKKLDVNFKVHFVGKLTTFLQCLALPVYMLGLPFAQPLIMFTCLVGIVSGIYYTKGCIEERKKLK